jgi:hypothetical protein
MGMCVSKDLPSWQELEEMFEADFEKGRLWNRKTGRELTGRNGVGYVCAKVNGKVCYRHRILVKMYLKDAMQEGLVVHHLNEIRGDDRISNLLSVTHQQNLEATALTASGRCGVSFSNSSNRWRAYVFFGKAIHLGQYSIEGMALTAREAAMSYISLGGDVENIRKVAQEAVEKAYGEDVFADTSELSAFAMRNYKRKKSSYAPRKIGRPRKVAVL